MVPIAMAASPSQKPSPRATASEPVKITVMLIWGANHTVNNRRAVP